MGIVNYINVDILSAIFPKNCFGCKKAGRYICSSCLAKEEIRRQVCPVCKRASIDGMTHTKCLKPRSLGGLASFWKYEGPVRRAIVVMKYRFAFDIARQLGEVLSDRLTTGFNPFPKERFW
jgi:predicted amidophosphoribosyltransferase